MFNADILFNLNLSNEKMLFLVNEKEDKAGAEIKN